MRRENDPKMFLARRMAKHAQQGEPEYAPRKA